MFKHWYTITWIGLIVSAAITVPFLMVNLYPVIPAILVIVLIGLALCLINPSEES